MNICQVLIETAGLFPGRTAISHDGLDLTYAELEQLSGQSAGVLAEAGVGHGDRVALILGNTPAFPVWYYGILRLGAIAVSVNTRLAVEEADHIVADCGAKVVVATAADATGESADAPGSVERVIVTTPDGLTVDGSPLRERPGLDPFAYENCDPHDPGIILYTSGTTGFPKGATLSHQNVRATIHAFNHLCRMTPNDRLLVTVPLFHCYGQNALLNAGLNAGATVILQGVFDLSETRRLIHHHRITKLFGVPTLFQLLLEACEADEIESVQYCFSAAATLPPQVGEKWHATFGMPIFEGYGLTETAPFASYNHRLEHRPGSIGTPVDLCEMKVIDPETGKTCPPDVPGEIVIKGPNVMLGYWNRPEETAEAVRDGWFHSGDVGTVDHKGYFFIVDRIKDMIAVGGMKVFPSEVERVLLDAPGVADCAVVSLPDSTWGEQVTAFVVRAPGADPDAESIRAHCLSHLATYKTPARVVYLDELPRNPAGKVLKKELRAWKTTASDPAALPTPPDSAPPLATHPDTLLARISSAHQSMRETLVVQFLQEEIRTLVAGDEPPSEEVALMETGMDSLMMVNLATSLRRELEERVELPATLVFDYPRIRDLAGHLVASLQLGPEKNPSPSRSSTPPPFAEVGDTRPIEELSEAEAMEALLRELED